MTTPSQEAVEAAKLAYGEARMRFQTGADDPLGPIIALLARPAPSQSDEERANLICNTHRSRMAAAMDALTAVRAESAAAEREAIEAIVQAEGNDWWARTRIAAAIRARKP